ncbi:helix-turn-helix transcriptional regulator [Actinomadura scrupuli]|uniref:helix-turn-helix transcriptional regulator n=1 Tax=Actinomadura scrupuli TaxID=559629 RepID=UPI003D999F15
MSRRGWRGRAQEWSVVTDLLRAAQAGQGGVLLIEGPSGIGKNRLLAEAANAAVARGIVVAQGRADELRRLAPLVPLLAALGETMQTLGVPEGLPYSVVGDLRLWLVDRLRAHLEERLARGPMLITLVDLQWADPTTLFALRTLQPELASYPLVWILARTSGAGDPAVVRLFEALEREGAGRMLLEPLDDDAVSEVAVDVLGAKPEADVLALAGGAGGNPFLLVELLGGLRDEAAIELKGGRAHLVSARLPQLPQRVHALARTRLDRLSRETRHLLQVAAVLGRTFSVDELAAMLGEPSSRLLPPLEEALTAQIILATDDALAFRHDLLWQAVTDSLPTSLRRALHLQAGHVLLDRGGSAVPAAAHFVSSARPGDTRALAGLDRAAREVLLTSPQTAAELAVRALELTDPADADRFHRTVAAVVALTAAGRLSEAAEFARAGLGQAPPDKAARLRNELARIQLLWGRPDEGVSEAEDVLAQQDLPDDLRDAAELTWFWGLIAAQDFERGRRRAEAIVAGRGRRSDTAKVGALMLLLHIAWVDGRVADGFDHIREAVRIAARGSVALHGMMPPRLYLALCLQNVREFDEAEAVLQAADEEIEARGNIVQAVGAMFVRAYLRAGVGRLDDAVAEAEAGLHFAEGTHVFALFGAAVLAYVAVLRGDLNAAAAHIEPYHAQAAQVTFPAGWGRWATLLVAEARGGPERAKAIFDAGDAEPRSWNWRLVTELNLAAWETRVALAAGDRAFAETVTARAQQLAQNNPDFPALAHAAAHARGLVHKDATALADAAAGCRTPWAGASAAEDLGILLAATDHQSAVHSLDQALDGYQRIGALRDAARVRARLRKLGVRRRHWTLAERPVSGWDSLTQTERNIAAHVAQGLTNRQVANRMFVSSHTVAFHLRNIFRKLDINSRVELARIAAEQPPESP